MPASSELFAVAAAAASSAASSHSIAFRLCPQARVSALQRHGLTGMIVEPLFHIVRVSRAGLFRFPRGSARWLMPAPQGREQLFLEATDHHGIATQTKPRPSWRCPSANRNTRQDRHDRGHHGQTGRGPVLGRGTVGHVHVDVHLVEGRRLSPRSRARWSAHRT